MKETIQRAEEFLREFKGYEYTFGKDALQKIGFYAAKIGDGIAVITGKNAKKSGILDAVIHLIEEEGLKVTCVFNGARPNAPKEDVYRIAYQLSRSKWDGVVAVGGGSCIDAAKAALTLKIYGGVIEDYFGTGKVTEKSGGKQIPLIAVQTASSSAAHLTKYSNITDMITYQKKLIVDESIVPQASVFQYDLTRTMPPALTKDGGLDGIAHCLEVWMGATNKDSYKKISEIAYLGIKLIVENLPLAVRNGNDMKARYSLGLGTDLGGYSIMLGGTNGGHLGSFSLVKYLSHGRACAILNPYYTVLFSQAIQDQLKKVATIYQQAGYMTKNRDLKGRDLAESVAKGMLTLSKNIDFPTTLREVGITLTQINKMLKAAKDPQLKMKLQNMPIPMDREDVDKLMQPTLKAAYYGDLHLIPDLS